MKRSPLIIVWHAQAAAYADALRELLPGVRVRGIAASGPDAQAAPDPPADLAAALGDTEALLAWKLPPAALGSMTALRWVQVSGAGVDHFLERPDLPADVLVTRSLGRFGQQVAEYVIGFLLHHLLEIDRYRHQQEACVWEQGARPLLADRTVGIIGLGSLGRPTAEALAALGARVLGVRRSGNPLPGVDRVLTQQQWRTMLPECDALVIAAPRTADTVAMVDAEALAALPRGAILINVARGDIVDEAALLDALENDHLGAAILDVFATEPLPPDHPLWSQPRARVTPHVAAPSEVRVVAAEFAENFRRYLEDLPLLNLVDRGRGY